MAASIEQFLKLDLSKWLKVLRDLELLPKFMNQDWSWIWLQKFDGHVTILVKKRILPPGFHMKDKISKFIYPPLWF